MDHPRVCGEKGMAGGLLLSGVGSPPRMRGKVIFIYNSSLMNRITPAYAGKSFVKLDLLCPYEDHPRVCGEKSTYSFIDEFELGSPPRMRGKG